MERSQRIEAIGKTLDFWGEVAENGSFEDAIDALEAIVTLLDEGDLTLDLSVRCLETGTQLGARCQLLLEQAELRISQLSSPPPQYDDVTVDVSVAFKAEIDGG